MSGLFRFASFSLCIIWKANPIIGHHYMVCNGISFFLMDCGQQKNVHLNVLPGIQGGTSYIYHEEGIHFSRCTFLWDGNIFWKEQTGCIFLFHSSGGNINSQIAWLKKPVCGNQSFRCLSEYRLGEYFYLNEALSKSPFLWTDLVAATFSYVILF